MPNDISLNVADIAAATAGTFYGQEQEAQIRVQNVVIDSRKAGPDTLYVPIIGERFDGHTFIESARQNGTPLVLSDRPLEGDKPYVLVANTLDALQALASLWRSRFSPFVVAVTGSAGKTTTKEMIALVLSKKYETLKTEGNLNNQTGVPQMLFRMNAGTQAAVIEMGMNHVGEIDRLAKMVQPNALVVTNVGTAHIEHLGSREGILHAKLEAVPYVQPDGIVFLNGDDDLLANAAQTIRETHAVRLFGLEDDCDIRAQNVENMGLEGTRFQVVTEDACFDVRLRTPGDYLVYSALSAAACGLAAGVAPEDIARALEAYEPVGSRMRVGHQNGYTVLDDTYNANLPATQAALEVLSRAPGAKVAILGDMYELGKQSAALHAKAIESALAINPRLVIGVGPLYEKACKEAWKDGPVLWFATQDELLEILDMQIDVGDTILVKGSHGMHMDRTVDHLLGADAAPGPQL